METEIRQLVDGKFGHLVIGEAVRGSHRDPTGDVVGAVRRAEKPEGKDRWLTRPEAARLLNAARTGRSDVRLYLPLFVLIGLYTGACKDAILSLRWPQIDLDSKPPRIDFRLPETRQTNKCKVRG